MKWGKIRSGKRRKDGSAFPSCPMRRLFCSPPQWEGSVCLGIITSLPCAFSPNSPCLWLFFAGQPLAYWSPFPEQEESLGLSVPLEVPSPITDMWPWLISCSKVNIPGLPGDRAEVTVFCLASLLYSLVSSKSTSLINHLHVSPHSRVCFWETL